MKLLVLEIFKGGGEANASLAPFYPGAVILYLRLCILELSRRNVVRPGVQYEREERLSEELKEVTDMVKLVRRSKAGLPLIKH